MRSELKDIVLPFFLTLIILGFFEVLATTLLPIFGLQGYTLPFHILVVLYLGFKLQTPYLSILIFIVQYFHAFFTIEGWEVGTIAGVIICILASYLKEVLHLTSALMTVLVSLLFQFFWFVIVCALMWLRNAELVFIVDKFWRFIPESFLMALLAPLVFSFLDRVWRVSQGGVLGEES